MTLPDWKPETWVAVGGLALGALALIGKGLVNLAHGLKWWIARRDAKRRGQEWQEALRKRQRPRKPIDQLFREANKDEPPNG